MDDINFDNLDLDSFDDVELDLRLSNDFVFGTVMRNERFCRKFLEMVLPELDIGEIVFTETQKSLQEGFDVRGVRFDVYSKSDSGKVYDIEIQTTSAPDLHKRTRAYHIEAGIDIMNKSKLASGEYGKLPDTFVIFICTFQPFKEHTRHIYTFCNFCREDKSIALNDGADTIFLSTKGEIQDISPELKAYLDFIDGKISDDPFVQELNRDLKLKSQNSEWRRSYMHYNLWEYSKQMQWLQQGRIEGRTEGRTDEKFDTAKRLRSIGLTDEQIHFATQLSLEEIRTL